MKEHQLKLDDCLTLGDYAVFDWNDEEEDGVRLAVFAYEGDKVHLIDISHEDARKLFSWLGAHLHKFERNRS